MAASSFTLPTGSLILVTGVNGLIASHIADQLLKHGYRVRGTVRDVQKSDWVRERFENDYGKNVFELVAVPDISVKMAFQHTMKDVSGVIHVASILSFSSDPEAVIPPTVAAVTSALEAAAATPSVKRFVFTSSSTAALFPVSNVRINVDSSTWNTKSVNVARSEPPHPADMAYHVYAASKTEAERALWQFVRDNKPQFTAAAVLPNFNVGPLMHPTKQPGSTAGWILGMYNGEEFGEQQMRTFPPQYYVDVRDSALLHVGALLLPQIKGGERLFGFAEPYTFNSVLTTLKKIAPERKFPAPLDDKKEDLSIVDTKPAEEVLAAMGKTGGWTNLETAIRALIESVK